MKKYEHLHMHETHTADKGGARGNSSPWETKTTADKGGAPEHISELIKKIPLFQGGHQILFKIAPLIIIAFKVLSQ